MLKLDARDRAQLVVVARRTGLTPLDDPVGPYDVANVSCHGCFASEGYALPPNRYDHFV